MKQEFGASGGSGESRDADIIKLGSKVVPAIVSLSTNTHEVDQLCFPNFVMIQNFLSPNTPPSGGDCCQELQLPHIP